MARLVWTAAKLWFRANWMYGGLIAAIFLLAILPLLGGGWSAALVATYLVLPVYMIHQVEEHAGDRFRRFVNRTVFHVSDALTTPMVLLINVPLVWGVTLASLYLARFVAPGWGLVAIYAMLVNAIAHVAAGAALRRANPGLVTAIVLFAPLGLWGVVAMADTPSVTATQQIVGVAFAILLHVGIVMTVLRRVRRLRAASA